MIRVMVDLYGLSEEIPTALVVRNESQFIESRLKIRDALREEKDLNVIIKNRKIGRWHESLRDYPDIKIEIVSPRSVLSQVLNLPVSLSSSLPISDPEIQELGLIKKAETNPPQTKLLTIKDIEDWVLTVCVGECWGKKGGTLTHYAEIISFFLNAKEYQKNSASERLIDKQKGEWLNSSFGESYKWLFMDRNNRAFLIYAWQILKNYDKTMKEKVLYEITEYNKQVLEPIKKYLEQIPSIECRDSHEKKSELSDLLEIKWKKTYKVSSI